MNTQSTALAVGEGARAADSAVPSVNPAINGPVAVNRRRFVLGASSALALGALPRTVFAGQAPQTRSPPAVLTGNRFDLHIGKQTVNFTGAERIATTVNNMLPGPILRWKEGDRVTLRVTNHLNEDSSIHWHGLILPSEMDGVPHMSFPGIKPGETFEYQFDVKQNGTYWYHSHSSFQEQTGLLGSIIIEPKEPDPVSYDRDFIVMLSDWSDESPHHIYHTLKKMSHYYNFRERTAGDLLGDLKEKGFVKTWRERAMWNQMRMSETDIADVTGYTYTYLMNGDTPDRGWVGLFKPGEKVRLRFINGAAMSIFDVRIPGLKMTVVAADGQNIQPVIVDEFRIGVAETYDVVVEPEGDRAYTVFAQTNDRTGYARGTLTPDVQLQAEIPAMDPAPAFLQHHDNNACTALVPPIRLKFATIYLSFTLSRTGIEIKGQTYARKTQQQPSDEPVRRAERLRGRRWPHHQRGALPATFHPLRHPPG